MCDFSLFIRPLGSFVIMRGTVDESMGRWDGYREKPSERGIVELLIEAMNRETRHHLIRAPLRRSCVTAFMLRRVYYPVGGMRRIRDGMMTQRHRPQTSLARHAFAQTIRSCSTCLKCVKQLFKRCCIQPNPNQTTAPFAQRKRQLRSSSAPVVVSKHDP